MHLEQIITVQIKAKLEQHPNNYVLKLKIFQMIPSLCGNIEKTHISLTLIFWTHSSLPAPIANCCILIDGWILDAAEGCIASSNCCVVIGVNS